MQFLSSNMFFKKKEKKKGVKPNVGPFLRRMYGCRNMAAPPWKDPHCQVNVKLRVFDSISHSM